MNNRLDVADDVILLSFLVMKRNLERCQMLEHTSYVDLGTASYTPMHIRKFQINESFQQLKDLFARGRCPRDIGTLIESIDNDINLALFWQAQHVLHTLCEGTTGGLSSAAGIVRI